MRNQGEAEARRPVSVIIPVRNAAFSIRSTLQSLHQDREVIHEVLLIDDGSSDATVPVAETAAKELNLPLTAVHVDFQSVGASRNAGLSKVQGRFVYFLDGDDQLVAGGLIALVQALYSNPDAGLAIGSYVRRTRGRADRVRTPSDYSTDRAANAAGYLQNRLRTIQIGSGLIRRVALDRIRFPNTLRYEEDVLFWTAVLSENDVIAIPSLVAIYNVDEARAVRRQTLSARARFLDFSKEVRTLRGFGIEDQVIRWRKRWVAYRIARALYLIGEPSAARRFVRIASADPLLQLRLAWLRLQRAVGPLSRFRGWGRGSRMDAEAHPMTPGQYRNTLHKDLDSRTDRGERKRDQKLFDQSR